MACRSASVPSVEITRMFMATDQLVQPGGGVVAEVDPGDAILRACEPDGCSTAVVDGCVDSAGSARGGGSTGPSGREAMRGGSTGASRRVSIGVPVQAGPRHGVVGSKMRGPLSACSQEDPGLEGPPH